MRHPRKGQNKHQNLQKPTQNEMQYRVRNILNQILRIVSRNEQPRKDQVMHQNLQKPTQK